MSSPAVVDWLLEGDPAIRWQVQRDLLDEPEPLWQATRDLTLTEGVVKRLVDHQDDDGRWDGGHYQPKWTSTTYTLLLLARVGLPPGHPAAIAGCTRLLDDAMWIAGGLTYWPSHTAPELCVNAMVLSACASFGLRDDRVDQLTALLVDRRLDDGGWNCRWHRGDRHSSFHTTISALEALTALSRTCDDVGVADAVATGHEFMLGHRLYRSHRTGEVIDERWTIAHFPPRWHYDVLRGLDHLRAAGARRDERAADAIGTVVGLRRADGRWPKGPQYSGRTFFPVESGGRGGRWNTLRALRVLRWWGVETDADLVATLPTA